MKKYFKMDGSFFKISDLSKKGRRNLELLFYSHNKMKELKNVEAVATRSKNIFIDNIKSEIVLSKSGIDLGSLFSGD